jgi:hypothetical protein
MIQDPFQITQSHLHADLDTVIKSKTENTLDLLNLEISSNEGDIPQARVVEPINLTQFLLHSEIQAKSLRSLKMNHVLGVDFFTAKYRQEKD